MVGLCGNVTQPRLFWFWVFCFVSPATLKKASKHKLSNKKCKTEYSVTVLVRSSSVLSIKMPAPIVPKSSLSYLPEYCTVLAQAMSPDGALLAVGEERGRVDVFRVEDIVERRKDDDADDQDAVKVRPRVTWHLGKPVLAMQATERHLVIGKYCTDVIGASNKYLIKYHEFVY